MTSKLAILVLMVSCVTPAADSSTNFLSINLVDAPLSHPWPYNGFGGATLIVISQPVLSDSDFRQFDVSNHTFAITAGAAKRLSRAIWDLAKRDAPGWDRSPTLLKDGFYELVPSSALFVFKVSGEPIYVGAFQSMGSSTLFHGPIAIADEGFISAGLKTNITFRIFYERPLEPVTDTASDARIMSAARKLFGHEKQ